MNELKMALVLSACHEHLAEQGIVVREFTDYGKLMSVIDKSSKDYLVPFLSDHHNDFHSSNALWIVGEADGAPVMLGGARLEELGEERLASYWPRLFRRHYGESRKDVITDVNDLLNEQMTGRLVYFGDLRNEPAYAGPKRTNIRAFTMIGHLLTQLRWKQDHTYAFIRRRDVGLGAAMYYGFNFSVPRPFRWIEEPFPRSKTEQCAFTSKAFLENNALDLIEDLEAVHEKRRS